MNWIKKILEKPVEQNPLDREIIKHQDVDKVYQARWVWYHTILAFEILLTNILLIAILMVLAFD